MHTLLKRSSAVLAVGLAGALSVAWPSHAGSTYKNKNGSTVHTFTCQKNGQAGDGDTLVYTGPDTMWPPNHKQQNVKVEAIANGSTADHPTSESITQFTVTVTNSDVVDGVEKAGSGNPSLPDTNGNYGPADGAGYMVDNFFLRAERSGTSPAGRTYTIAVTANFGDGSDNPCTKSWDVTVPHDMGNNG